MQQITFELEWLNQSINQQILFKIDLIRMDWLTRNLGEALGVSIRMDHSSAVMNRQLVAIDLF